MAHVCSVFCVCRCWCRSCFVCPAIVPVCGCGVGSCRVCVLSSVLSLNSNSIHVELMNTFFSFSQVPFNAVALRVIHTDVAPSNIMYAVNASWVGLCCIPEEVQCQTDGPVLLTQTPVCDCLGFGEHAWSSALTCRVLADRLQCDGITCCSKTSWRSGMRYRSSGVFSAVRDCTAKSLDFG